MRKVFAFFLFTVAIFFAASAVARSSSPAQSAAPSKPATTGHAHAVAKPAVHAVTKPTAVIHTTAGNITCTLFPDKAPIGVANFIGLAGGTKDWKNPVSGANKHGVPLYDGTIFHRVIPGFMIQGGDPAGNGTRRSRLQVQERSFFGLAV